MAIACASVSYRNLHKLQPCVPACTLKSHGARSNVRVSSSLPPSLPPSLHSSQKLQGTSSLTPTTLIPCLAITSSQLYSTFLSSSSSLYYYLHSVACQLHFGWETTPHQHHQHHHHSHIYLHGFASAMRERALVDYHGRRKNEKCRRREEGERERGGLALVTVGPYCWCHHHHYWFMASNAGLWKVRRKRQRILLYVNKTVEEVLGPVFSCRINRV